MGVDRAGLALGSFVTCRLDEQLARIGVDRAGLAPGSFVTHRLDEQLAKIVPVGDADAQLIQP